MNIFDFLNENYAIDKPIRLIELFGGSGSKMIASEQAQRKSMLMELDEKYADVIVKRYIRLKGSLDNCFLFRNGVNLYLNDRKLIYIKQFIFISSLCKNCEVIF